MFGSNSIFQQADEEEQKQVTTGSYQLKQNDQHWIKDDLAKLLDEELDLNRQDDNSNSNGDIGSSLSHQFESAENNGSLFDQAFAEADKQETSSSSGLVFPEDSNSSENCFKNNTH
jgi:hypothetical protein